MRMPVRRQYDLELDYRVFTGAAHLFFNSITQALSVGGMVYGGGLVQQGHLKLEDLMRFMQYAFKIGHALGGLLSILNEQQRALMSASKVCLSLSLSVCVCVCACVCV